MRPVHERLLAAIAEERRRLASRRQLLRNGAKLAAGGALIGAFAAAPVSRGLRVSAQDFTDDLDILNYALTLELLEAAFYRDGLESFGADGVSGVSLEVDDEGTSIALDDHDDDDDDDDDDDESGNEDGSVFALLTEIRDHEQAHVDALTQTITDLGGEPVVEAEYDFGDAFDDIEAFLETAQALENTGVSAYLGALPFITDAAILSAAGGIATVEARHAAFLNLLNEESPFPAAVDEALTRAEVLEIAGAFIVADAAADADADAGADADADATVTAEADADADADVTATVDADADAEVTATVAADLDVDVTATVEADVDADVDVDVDADATATESS